MYMYIYSSQYAYIIFQLIDNKLGHFPPLPSTSPFLPGHQPVLIRPHSEWGRDLAQGSRHSTQGKEGGREGKEEGGMKEGGEERGREGGREGEREGERKGSD